MPVEGMALKGKPCIHIYLSVPGANEESADGLFKSHVGFMKKTHAIGAVGTEPRILEYTIAKGKEMNDPMDPSKGETGNIIYCVSEVYATPESIPAHMAAGEATWENMAKFKECIANFGKTVDFGSQVLTCFSDNPVEPCTASVGDATFYITYTCPASAEKEMDDFFVSHEKFMREMHTFDKSADDSVTPRLTSFHISKAPEAKNPMDPSAGTTGNICYYMAETYAAPTGVSGHMKIAETKWGPGFAKFNEVTGKYATFMAPGLATVCGTMHV